MSPDQSEAYEVFDRGENLFLTGAGGTGKSHLIRQFALKKTRNVQVCAMTGTAAMLLECAASTLHSWAGIGTGKGDLMAKVTDSFFAKKKWREVDTLVLDEVSMLDQDLFEKLDAIAKKVRRSSLPFGGMQVVFCGDFCQLPPVSESGAANYCFQSALWDVTFPNELMLSTIHRQKDAAFCKILQQLRLGKITRSSYDLLMSRVLSETRRLEFPTTQIVPTREKAEHINRTEYEKLQTEEHVFTSKVIYDYEMSTKKRKLRSGVSQQQLRSVGDQLQAKRATHVLKLKEGAHVMCVHNIDARLCNGTQGTVVRFEAGAPVVKIDRTGEIRRVGPVTIESDQIEGVAVVQVPLMYAWAITIHKAQGATLDAAVIDVGDGIFESGQTYTALSRLSSFDYLYLSSFNPEKIKTNPLVIDYYKKTFPGI